MELKKSRKFIIVKYSSIFLIHLIVGVYLGFNNLFYNGYTISIYGIFWIAAIYLFERDLRYGGGIVYNKIDAQEKLEGIFHKKVEGELVDFFNIVGNKSLFHLFSIEFLIASNKYDWDDNNRFFRKEKGWHRNYRSSKQALIRYSYKYQEVFEGKFHFLLTFLTAVIAIKNDFYRNLIESTVKGRSIPLMKRTIQEVIPKVHGKIVNCDKDFLTRIISNNKKNFSYLRFNYTPKTEKNLKLDRTRVLNRLAHLGMDEKAIQAISNMSLEDYNDTKKYQAYFKSLFDIRKCSTSKKLAYLNENGYDFMGYVKKSLRNRFVHHINLRLVKMHDGTCAFKVIFGKNRNDTITITEYYEGLCKLYALTDYLYIQLINRPSSEKGQNTWRYSLDQGIKALKNPDLNLF